MPVDLSIVESTTELGQTVVEVILDSSSAPGVAGPGVPPGGTTGQVLKKASDTDLDTEWDDASAPGAHASTHQDGGADEISLTGLSGIPAALTTHEADTTAVHGIADTSVLATDAEVATAVSDHSADTTSVHGIADTSVLATDSEVATAVSDHSADTTAVHGIADTSALALTANHPSNATFNDHSARHEDGGADEISIAGLAGTPTDLQTHLDDATAAHAGSAVSVDSTTLSGTGTTVQASLEELDNLLDDHSARHEDGGADEISIAGLAGTSAALQAHLDDAADAHDASAVSVVDTAGYFAGADVETVLAALGGNGTSFPGSPTSNDRFYRTDRDLLYFYDGTRWLTVAEYTMPLVVRTALGAGISATSTLANAPTRGASGDMFIEDLRVVAFNSGTSDGSNFWVVTLDKLTAANAATNVGTVSTANDATVTWVEHVDAIDEVVVGSAHLAFRVIATKTASAGNLICGIEITYRLVG